MNYHLWDIEIGKKLGFFQKEDEALTMVRVLIDHYGVGYAESLALGREDDAGVALAPLSGSELVARIGVEELIPDQFQPNGQAPALVGARRPTS